MLSAIRDYWRGRRAIRALQATPIGAAAVAGIRRTIGDTSQGLGRHASKKFKTELAQRLLQDALEVLSSSEQVLANREKLAAFTVIMAKYQVLVLPPAGDPEPETTGLRGLPGITGELRAHLAALAGKDDELRQLRFSLPDASDDTLYQACLLSYWRAGVAVNVFDDIRRTLGDCHSQAEKDWYRPFLVSMCAWEEHTFRSMIGLPDVLAVDDEFGTMAGLKHSAFLNIVMSGVQYPNLEWQDRYNR